MVLPKLAQLDYENYKKETENKVKETEKAGVEFNELFLNEETFIKKFKSEFI